MNIEEILKNIEFKIGPHINYRKAYFFRLKKFFHKIIKREKHFIFDNCKIKNIKENIFLKNSLLEIDSMSTYAIGFLINQICKNLSKDQIYLNIGCWKGFSLVAGMIDTKCNVIGIDNFSQFDGPKKEFYLNFEKHKKLNHSFYEKNYKEFFKNFDKMISFYFYDGEHSYQNQFDNLQIVDQFLDSNSIILIDDYNFSDVENATKNFVDKSKNNYSIIKEIKTFNNHCHPTYWNGIAILKKK